MSYLREFTVNWQAFTSTCLGLIAGTSSIYLNNLFFLFNPGGFYDDEFTWGGEVSHDLALTAR